MIVRVLGSAAGGGVPQWNCACANCSAARAGTAPRRTQSGFAVSADGDRWWLVNCSPDIAQQIEATPALQPRGVRGTPIAGMLFTDANIDHLGGLAVVRQSGDHAFTIVSSPVVREIAQKQPMCAPFFSAPHAWRTLEDGDRLERDGLEFTAVAVDGLTPGFDGRRRVPGAVSAFAVTDAASRVTAVFAPVFVSIGSDVLKAVAGADAAFVDGSFWSDDELASVGVPKAAESLGHLPMAGDGGSLQALRDAARTTPIFFAHLNNTNPVLDPASSASRAVAEAGMLIASDGLELKL